jgi:hypothetical protein
VEEISIACDFSLFCNTTEVVYNTKVALHHHEKERKEFFFAGENICKKKRQKVHLLLNVYGC